MRLTKPVTDARGLNEYKAKPESPPSPSSVITDGYELPDDLPSLDRIAVAWSTRPTTQQQHGQPESVSSTCVRDRALQDHILRLLPAEPSMHSELRLEARAHLSPSRLDRQLPPSSLRISACEVVVPVPKRLAAGRQMNSRGQKSSSPPTSSCKSPSESLVALLPFRKRRAWLR